VVYTSAAGEMVVAGVFLRLYIANPGWVLRKPREFITELLEKWSAMSSVTSPDGEALEVITTAICAFCEANQALLDQIPQLGHIPKIFRAMSSRNNAIPKTAILITHQLSFSGVCIRAMAQTDCIGSLKVGMKTRRDMIGVACEALNKIFSQGEEDLVEQALKVEMVDFLVRLLETGLETLENSAATKAQIVKALKSMQRSLKYGEEVTVILDKQAVWREYKDQKHDLFISDRPIAGYLTGPAVAGYLTAGNARSSMPDAPPPMDN